jgi:hypothetical protein
MNAGTYEIEITCTCDGIVEEVHSAACRLLALGRERILAVAGGYLVADDPAVAAELEGLTLDNLALRAVGRAVLCQKLDELNTAAREALDEMTPEQQLAAAREREPFFSRAPAVDPGPNDNLHCGPPPKP